MPGYGRNNNEMGSRRGFSGRRAPTRGAPQPPSNSPRLTRGNGTPGRGGPRMAKYSGHIHDSIGPRLHWNSTSQWPDHTHTTGMESPPHTTSNPSHHHTSSSWHPATGSYGPHSHTMHLSYDAGPHSGSMGSHVPGYSQLVQGHRHDDQGALNTGQHIHQKGQRPPQPRSGTQHGYDGNTVMRKRTHKRRRKIRKPVRGLR